MSSTLSLSALIARMSQEELRTLIAFRRVPTPANIVDPLGLALEYLRVDSIMRAISHLDGNTLSLLAQGNLADVSPATLAVLRERALIGYDEREDVLVVLPEVQAAVSAALNSAGLDPTVLTHDARLPHTPEAAQLETDTSGWFGQAVAAVRIATALLRTLRSEPAKMNRKGIVAAIAVRSVSDSLSVQPEHVASLLNALEWAGIATPQPDSLSSTVTRLTVSPASERWVQLSYPERWITLAAAVARNVSVEVHATNADVPANLGWAATAGLRTGYPLLPEIAIEQAARCAAAAESLGATVNGVITEVFSAVLTGNIEQAALLANSEFPVPAPGVYVQPDLTIIVPGPITAVAEQTLFDIAEIDQLGAAAVLRITQRSLERALRIGYTTATIRETLTRLSFTGIPQPLDFMLTDLERERPILTQTLSSNHTHAASWVQKQASQGSQPETKNTPVSETEQRPEMVDPQQELADRVYEAAHLAPGGGDLSRLLELAIRDRSTVQVTAAAGADVRTFTLLPLAVTSGRLRATDQIAGVERTLPLTAITTVIPA